MNNILTVTFNNTFAGYTTYTMELLGKWEGYYKYDNPHAQSLIGHEWTTFQVTIHSFDGVYFKGTINDDETMGGTPGTGTIEGSIKKARIRFQKRMPVNIIIYENGERTRTDKEHPTLYYSGIVLDGALEMKGSWKFRKKFGLLRGFLPILYSPGTGFWGMKRIE